MPLLVDIDSSDEYWLLPILDVEQLNGPVIQNVQVASHDTLLHDDIPILILQELKTF
jgi:hypothetical protein